MDATDVLDVLCQKEAMMKLDERAAEGREAQIAENTNMLARQVAQGQRRRQKEEVLSAFKESQRKGQREDRRSGRRG